MSTLPPDVHKISKVNEWTRESRRRSNPRMLFGEFWLEGELAILFADTGKGKSVLAVQIAESIARGRPIAPFQLTAKPQKVLYFDYELTGKQFEMRYSADPAPGTGRLRRLHRFSDRFYRAEVDPEACAAQNIENFELCIRSSLETAIRRTGAKVVIIDNITYIRGPHDTARACLPVMRELQRLKKQLGLSVLVLAHTPKRDNARRLTVNDLQGSKILSNFADSIFAIGQSAIDTGIRYLKQIKQRSTDLVYDSGYVPAFELAKHNGNFLSFNFRAFGDEERHLSSRTNAISLERAKVIAAMTLEGMSQRAIAAELGISAASVNRYLHMAKPHSEQDEEEAYNVNFYDEDVEPEDSEKREQDEVETDSAAIELADRERIAADSLRHTDNYLRKIGIHRPWLNRDWEEDNEYDEAVDEYEEDTKDDYGGEASELGQLGELGKLGQLEFDSNGRPRRRTLYGWDYCVEAIE